MHIQRLLRFTFRQNGVYMRLGNTPEALAACYHAEAVAQQQQNSEQQAHLYRILGNTHFSAGNAQKAVEAYNKAVELHRANDNKAGMAIIYNNLCHTQSQTEQLEAGLQSGLAGLQIYEQFAESHNISAQVHGYLLNNIGNTYLALMQFETAVPYFQTAANIFQEKEIDPYGELYSVRGLAQIHLHNQQYDQALAKSNEALALADRCEIVVERVKSHQLLARAYKTAGRL